MEAFNIAFYVFAGTLLSLIVVFRYVSTRKQIRDRLTHLSDAQENSFLGLRALVRRLSVYFEAVPWAKKQEDLLLQAGIPFRGSEFMVLSLAVALGAVLLLLLFLKASLLLAIAGGIVAFYLPTIIVKQRIKKKQAQFDEQLPSALTLMSNSLRTGYSYMQAIDLVAKEMTYPINEEFALVLKEISLGITTEEAFKNLVRRVNTADLDLTVTAFLIQRQVGGNLAELLDNIAETIRDRVKMKGKIGALTAQGKLSGVVLCLLPIGVMLILYASNPNFLKDFINYPTGRLVLGIALAGQVIGVIWMRKIINIAV